MCQILLVRKDSHAMVCIISLSILVISSSVNAITLSSKDFLYRTRESKSDLMIMTSFSSAIIIPHL